MKKAILILAGALCLSGAVMAQDTTRTQPTQPTQPNQTTQTPDQNYKKDMVQIKSTEVPASLKTTLQGSQYKGWEAGTVYRNQNSDMYLVEMKEGSNPPKTYRFDANGKVIE